MQNLSFFDSYDPILKRLNLRGAEYVPKEVFNFSDAIEILDLSQGLLTTLPDELPQLKNLKIIFCSNNPFTKVPKILAQCKNLTMVGFKGCQLQECGEDALPKSLKWLVLSHNKLQQLPNSMGQLIKLEKVGLAGNQFSSLPESMQACTEIEFLRLSANNFTKAPPAWVFNLPKLAWYGDNGNPFCQEYNSFLSPRVANISWNDISIVELLGQSPSSQVFKGILNGSQTEVAVKLYRGDLTSDGYPLDDMHAAIMAGEHENLVQISGKLIDLPEKKQGLVFNLIPKSYSSLGLPPSLESCSRDTYVSGARFSLLQIKHILQCTAKAAAHLHARGMAHGDLYAHNILMNQQGHCYLGDFGAASFYDPTETIIRQYIDVRAFGCLIGELLQRCDMNEDKAYFNVLKKRQLACLEPDPWKRPLFSELCSAEPS